MQLHDDARRFVWILDGIPKACDHRGDDLLQHFRTLRHRLARHGHRAGVHLHVVRKAEIRHRLLGFGELLANVIGLVQIAVGGLNRVGRQHRKALGLLHQPHRHLGRIRAAGFQYGGQDVGADTGLRAVPGQAFELLGGRDVAILDRGESSAQFLHQIAHHDAEVGTLRIRNNQIGGVVKSDVDLALLNLADGIAGAVAALDRDVEALLREVAHLLGDQPARVISADGEVEADLHLFLSAGAGRQRRHGRDRQCHGDSPSELHARPLKRYAFTTRHALPPLRCRRRRPTRRRVAPS